MEFPILIVGVDLETSGWGNSGYVAQARHLRADSCREDHTRDVGCICQLGWSVFQHLGGGEYHQETPNTLTVKLPAGERFTPSGLRWHLDNGTGLNDDICRQGGMSFEAALEQLLILAAKESVLFIMHNKAHEYFVFCRDVQKHGLSGKCNILLRRLRDGKCTADLSRTFNDGWPMKLGDAYKHSVADSADSLQAHKAGDDAMMSALIYLRHEGLTVKTKHMEDLETLVPEDAADPVPHLQHATSGESVDEHDDRVHTCASRPDEGHDMPAKRARHM